MPGTEHASLEPDYPPREERRAVTLTGWLVRPGQERAHDFLIDNLSYGGCRMQSAARLSRGDEVHLTVLRRGAIPGTVRWHNAYGIGVSFSPEPPPEKAQQLRKVERVPLETELVVRQAGRRARVLAISDFSRFGCCLTFEDQPFEGEWVWVAPPGLSPLEARVRWTEGRRAGVEFVHPVHDAVFDLLLIRWGIAGD